MSTRPLRCEQRSGRVFLVGWMHGHLPARVPHPNGRLFRHPPGSIQMASCSFVNGTGVLVCGVCHVVHFCMYRSILGVLHRVPGALHRVVGLLRRVLEVLYRVLGVLPRARGVLGIPHRVVRVLHRALGPGLSPLFCWRRPFRSVSSVSYPCTGVPREPQLRPIAVRSCPPSVPVVRGSGESTS